MTVTVIIDRIEAELAVLEVGEHTVHWPVAHLPEGAAEGSVLQLSLGQAAPDEASRRVRSRAGKRSQIDL